jgi:hypothetical protein
MAMSNRIRQELGKLRELAWHFLEGEKCFFCRKDLLGIEDMVNGASVRFGNATAPPMDLDITIHHRNGNHEDNRKRNRKLAHATCHKQHHANLVFAEVNGVKPKVMRPADYRRAA